MNIARCLETRRDQHGFRRRRVLLEDGTRAWTIEVPLEVWRGCAAPARVQERLAKWQRARQAEAAKARALELIEMGWKSEAVAHETGFTTRTIQRWARAFFAKRG